MTVALIALLVIVAVVVAINLIVGRLPKRPPAGGGVVSTSYGTLHYLETPPGPNAADGELPIVFIHGMPGIANEFDPVREALGSRHMIAFDRPGYAWSEGKPLSFTEQVDAIHEAAKTLGIDRAVVVGHSFGGLVTLGMAIRHGDFVDRMLLLAPAAGGTRVGEDRMRQARLIQKLQRPGIRQLADLLFLRIVRRHASRIGAAAAYGESPQTERQRHLAESVLARHNSIAALANDRLLFNDAERLVTANLGRIECPSVIVHGEDDQTVLLRNAERLAAALPNTKLEVVEGDHQLPSKNTAQVVAATNELLTL